MYQVKYMYVLIKILKHMVYNSVKVSYPDNGEYVANPLVHESGSSQAKIYHAGLSIIYCMLTFMYKVENVIGTAEKSKNRKISRTICSTCS